MSLTKGKRFVGGLFSITLRRSLIVPNNIHFVVFYKREQIAHGNINTPWDLYCITMSFKTNSGLTEFSIAYKKNVYREIRSQILNKILN